MSTRSMDCSEASSAASCDREPVRRWLITCRCSGKGWSGSSSKPAAMNRNLVQRRSAANVVGNGGSRWASGSRAVDCRDCVGSVPHAVMAAALARVGDSSPGAHRTGAAARDRETARQGASDPGVLRYGTTVDKQRVRPRTYGTPGQIRLLCHGNHEGALTASRRCRAAPLAVRKVPSSLQTRSPAASSVRISSNRTPCRSASRTALPTPAAVTFPTRKPRTRPARYPRAHLGRPVAIPPTVLARHPPSPSVFDNQDT